MKHTALVLLVCLALALHLVRWNWALDVVEGWIDRVTAALDAKETKW